MSALTSFRPRERGGKGINFATYTDSDGLKGTVQYRGYDIADIVGKKTFIDTAHLLIWGHWPSSEEARGLHEKLSIVPLIEKPVFDVIQAFP